MNFPDFRLTDKIAIVTGASKGLGYGTALALADAGAHVVVTSRAQERVEPVAEEIRQMGREALPLPLEVRSLESIDTVVQATIERFGRIDILVNNAGINIPEPALEVTEEHWDRLMDINLKGLFFCAQKVGQVMVAQGGGKIINIGSQMGFVGGKLRAAYCSSKGGVVQLTKVLAIEWAEHGVNVNGVAPTFIRTPFTAAMFENKEFYEEVVGNILFGRLAEVEDILGAIIFLASSAADLITGHTLLVDGGWTIK
ncbi:MAG TPA: glucose 1-dehydrogenase [Anaerolineae bacterium]|nr:glucose 1-dehydrogenase [Anaerolineae bacterium]